MFLYLHLQIIFVIRSKMSLFRGVSVFPVRLIVKIIWQLCLEYSLNLFFKGSSTIYYLLVRLEVGRELFIVLLAN